MNLLLLFYPLRFGLVCSFAMVIDHGTSVSCMLNCCCQKFTCDHKCMIVSAVEDGILDMVLLLVLSYIM